MLYLCILLHHLSFRRGDQDAIKYASHTTLDEDTSRVENDPFEEIVDLLHPTLIGLRGMLEAGIDVTAEKNLDRERRVYEKYLDRLDSILSHGKDKPMVTTDQGIWTANRY